MADRQQRGFFSRVRNLFRRRRRPSNVTHEIVREIPVEGHGDSLSISLESLEPLNIQQPAPRPAMLFRRHRSIRSPSAGQTEAVLSRLRDNILELFAVYLLDQHEIEAAEAELAHLEQLQEVVQLRSSLEQLEDEYDKWMTMSGNAAGSVADSQGLISSLEERLVVSRLVYLVSVRAAELAALQHRQSLSRSHGPDHPNNPAQHADLPAMIQDAHDALDSTMARLVSSGEADHMVQLREEEQSLSSVRRRFGSTTMADSGLLPPDIMSKVRCQKFHVNQLKRRLHGKHTVKISRDNLLQDSIAAVRSTPAVSLRHGLTITFEGEEGRDFGGIAREWFQTFSHRLVMQGMEEGFLKPSALGSSVVQIVEEAGMNAWPFMLVLGKLLGLALFHNRTVHPFVSPVFFKNVLDDDIKLEDIAETEPSICNSLKYLLDCENPSELDLVFTITDDDDPTKEVSLVPGGVHMRVTESNRDDYVRLYLQHRFGRKESQLYEAVREGITAFITLEDLGLLTPSDLCSMLSGTADVNIKDWKDNTLYENGYANDSDVIGWFWEIMEDYDNLMRATVIKFVTGSHTVPMLGFSRLQGSHGTCLFTIAKHGDVSSLPVGHTCVNRLDLPPYQDKDTLRTKLQYAVQETQGFNLV